MQTPETFDVDGRHIINGGAATVIGNYSFDGYASLTMGATHQRGGDRHLGSGWPTRRFTK